MSTGLNTTLDQLPGCHRLKAPGEPLWRRKAIRIRKRKHRSASRPDAAVAGGAGPFAVFVADQLDERRVSNGNRRRFVMRAIVDYDDLERTVELLASECVERPRQC